MNRANADRHLASMPKAYEILQAYKGMTMDEIGKRLGISRQRVHQIIKKARNSQKSHAKKH